MQTSIDDLKINYEVLGDGKPILLLHGWGGSLESLRAVSHQLLAVSLKPIIIDLPGFGKSDAPNSDYSLDDYAEIVEEFLKQQGISELYVFGHSFGGAVAVKLAVRGNIVVKKLILCNASGIRQKAEGKRLKATSYQLPASLKIIKKVSRWPIIKNIYPAFRKFYYYYILRNRDYIDHQEIAGTFKKIVAEDITPILKDVRVPTLLVWGELDKDTPVEHARVMKSQIPNSKLQIFPGIGHGLPKQKPELIAKEIVSFIRSG